MSHADRIRALLVDDSHFMRLAIARELSQYADIEVVGSARNGEEAVHQVLDRKPQVVVMDVRMPVMDGITAVRRIMEVQPIPIVMLSAYTIEGAAETLEAMAAGAVDFVSKPSGEVSVDLSETVRLLVEKLRAARTLHPRAARAGRPILISPGTAPPSNGSLFRVAAIGASTGGPSALETLLAGWSPDLPLAGVIIQHMPPAFTTALAERLDKICRLRVREAKSGDAILSGTALVVPGDANLTVAEDGRVRLDGNVDLYPFRPCIDVTLKSVSEAFRSRAIGVLLTGMGRDGAEGLSCIKARGGSTLVQDEKTSLIYSMPKAAVALGCVDRILPIEEMADALARCVAERSPGTKGD